MLQIAGCDVYGGLLRYVPKLVLVMALICSTNALAQPECGQPTLLAPVKEMITDTRPRIEWSPVPGAKFYQVWVESRVPEGRVLFAQDVQTTATFWRPPQPLTDYRANVKIRVQANCGGTVEDQEKFKPPISRFSIDTSAICIMSEAPTIKLNQQGVELSWRATPEARSYEVSVFPTQSRGGVVVRSETPRTSVRLERPANGIWTIGVRPRCTNGFGAFRFHILNVI